MTNDELRARSLAILRIEEDAARSEHVKRATDETHEKWMDACNRVKIAEKAIQRKSEQQPRRGYLRRTRRED